jgi:poly(3-hydroxyalkanoate) synthetase
VLSYSGHIASLVNPAGNAKAHYWTGGPPGADPQQWLADAHTQHGSWWQAWADWITARSGDQQPAPEELGSGRYPVLDPAPRALRARHGAYALRAARNVGRRSVPVMLVIIGLVAPAAR